MRRTAVVCSPLTDRSIASEEKRRLILDAAVRVFARKGYHASRVGDIAEEAGVAHGLLYHYFTSKEQLLETVFRDTWSELLEAIARVAESAEPAREQLRQVAAILLRSWRRDPDLVRVLVREVGLEQLPRLAEDRLEHLFLRAEVVIEQPVRDARLLGDVADARGVVALAREDADGRVEDQPALLLRGC